MALNKPSVSRSVIGTISGLVAAILLVASLATFVSTNSPTAGPHIHVTPLPTSGPGQPVQDPENYTQARLRGAPTVHVTGFSPDSIDGSNDVAYFALYGQAYNLTANQKIWVMQRDQYGNLTYFGFDPLDPQSDGKFGLIKPYLGNIPGGVDIKLFATDQATSDALSAAATDGTAGIVDKRFIAVPTDLAAKLSPVPADRNLHLDEVH